MTKLFFEQMESRRLFAAGTLISVPDVVGATFDATRNRLYVASGSQGVIYRYDVGTSQMLEPIDLGMGPIGSIDMAADDSGLYTVMAGVYGSIMNRSGGLLRLDLGTEQVSRVAYPLSPHQIGGFSPVVSSSGRVLIGHTDGGSVGIDYLKVYDPGAVSPSVEVMVPQVFTETNIWMVASADRSVVYVARSRNYGYPATFVDLDRLRVISTGTPNGTFGFPALNRDGTAVAIPGAGVFDQAFNQLADASAVGFANAFVPGTGVLINSVASLGVVSSFNVTTRKAGPSVAVEGLRPSGLQPWEAGGMGGPLIVHPNGATAFVSIPGGYREVALPAFAYDPPKLTGPTTTKEGQVLSLTGTAEFGPGASAIEWDTNYDGVTFTADAVGSSVEVAGLNGPGSVVVAARVAAGERSSDVVTRTINVAGVAPTGRLAVAVDAVSRVITARVEDVVDVAADVAAGMRFDFDLDGDGVYEIAGATAPVATRVVPVDATLPVTVRARVVDVDGLGTEYSTRAGLVLQAVIGATPATVDAGATLTLDATSSFGAAQPISTYEWDLDYDGSVFNADVNGATAALVAPTRELAAGIGARTVALRVTDTAGVTSVVTRGVRVVKLAPVVLGVEAAKVVGAAVSRTVEVRVRAGSGLDAGSVAGSRLRLVGPESIGVTVESAGASVRADGEAGVYVLSYVFNAPGVGWTTALDGQYSASFSGEPLKTNEGIALEGTLGEVGLGHVAAVAGSDLSVAIVGMPTSVRAGKAAKVTLMVRNEGSVASGSGAGVRVLFSSDRFEGAGDDVLARVRVPARIRAGASRTFSATIKVPEARGGMDGFLMATLDRGQAEPVENSGNNWAAPAGMRVEKKWFVQLVPVLTRQGSLIVQPNATIRFTYLLRNTGTLNGVGDVYVERRIFRVSTTGGEDEIVNAEDATRSLRFRPGAPVKLWSGGFINEGSDVPGDYYFRLTAVFTPANGSEPVALVTETPRFTLIG